MEATEIDGIEMDARVVRADGTGCKGIVSSVREDSIAKGDERGIIIGVQWDNGTYSYFTPDALKVASKK